jgi:hypothetical protein
VLVADQRLRGESAGVLVRVGNRNLRQTNRDPSWDRRIVRIRNQSWTSFAGFPYDPLVFPTHRPPYEMSPLAEMRALKQAGLAQVQIDTFTSGFLDILVGAATAAIPL